MIRVDDLSGIGFEVKPGTALKRGDSVCLHIPAEDCLLIRRGEV